MSELERLNDHAARESLEELLQDRDRWRSRYRQLQEETGSALVRAHVLRGDRELDAAKLAEALSALVGAAESLLAVLDEETVPEARLEAPWGAERRSLRAAVDAAG